MDWKELKARYLSSCEHDPECRKCHNRAEVHAILNQMMLDEIYEQDRLNALYAKLRKEGKIR